MTTARISTAARRQRGVYAVEFAFVFLIFFTLLYAIICYGILFTLRFAMQNAAEDGARAALQYQPTVSAREIKAQTIAATRAGGLFPTPATAVATICTVVDNDCAAATRTCSVNWEQRCQVIVTITAADIAKMLPPLPSFAVPDTLAVQASMLLDGNAL